SACSAILRNADTGVSRSATISLHTGTKVPRRASSLNSSNEVIFIARKLRQPLERGLSHHTGPGRRAGPPLKLLARLRDEHVEAADGLTAHGRRLPQEARGRRVVDQIVDIASGELRLRDWRLVDPRIQADRRAIDQQIPAPRLRRPWPH